MKRQKVLVVDDHEVVVEGLTKFLGGYYIALCCTTIEKALELLSSEEFDAVLSDVHIRQDDGYELAKVCRMRWPRMAIVMMTADTRVYFDQVDMTLDVDAQVDKATEPLALIETIDNAIEKRKAAEDTRWRWSQTLSYLSPHRNAVRLVKESSRGDALRIDGMTRRWPRRGHNGRYQKWWPPRPLAFVVYSGPEIEGRNVICLPSSIGCVGECAMCDSQFNRFERGLETREILAMVWHALHTYKTRGWDVDLTKVDVNFAKEGDGPISNLDNICRAIEILHGSRRLGLDLRFIATTMGHAGNLMRFAAQYSHLPVMFYWSLNFVRDDQHALFMPHAPRGQSLLDTRDAFTVVGEATGLRTTVSIAVARGVNDSREDALRVVSLFITNPDPFEFKVMPMASNSLPGQSPTTMTDVVWFGHTLEDLGLPRVRVRKIVAQEDENFGGSCGSTRPYRYVKLKKNRR